MKNHAKLRCDDCSKCISIPGLTGNVSKVFDLEAPRQPAFWAPAWYLSLQWWKWCWVFRWGLGAIPRAADLLLSDPGTSPASYWWNFSILWEVDVPCTPTGRRGTEGHGRHWEKGNNSLCSHPAAPEVTPIASWVPKAPPWDIGEIPCHLPSVPL